MSRVLMARRRGLGLGSESYTACDYIYPTVANTYISTGILATSEISVETSTRSYTSDGGGSGFNIYSAGTYLGARVSTYYGDITLSWNGSRDMPVHFAFSTTTPTIVGNVKNRFYQGSSTIKTFTYSSWTSTSKITMFGGNWNSYFPQKWYYGKIWDGDTLVRDFTPAYDSNGVGCMYDNVSGKAFYSAAADQYSWGND